MSAALSGFTDNEILSEALQRGFLVQPPRGRETTNRIAELRRRRDLTRQQLADRMGVRVQTIARFERGELTLSGPWPERFAFELSVHVSEIRAGCS